MPYQVPGDVSTWDVVKNRDVIIFIALVFTAGFVTSALPPYVLYLYNVLA